MGAAHESAVDAPRSRGERRTFVSEDLLDATFDDSDRGALARRLHVALRTLTVHEAALDLRIGEGLHRLTGELSFRTLGHSEACDFAPERYGFSWSHGRELIKIALALRDLPMLRQAFLHGHLGRAKVREVIRVATPETEAGWIGVALHRGVRGLQDAIVRFKQAQHDVPSDTPHAKPAADHEPAPQYERVSWNSSVEDAAIWNGHGRVMIRTVLGDDHAPDWKLAEGLAAETITRLGAEDDGCDPDDDQPNGRMRAGRGGRPLNLKHLRALGELARRRIPRGAPSNLWWSDPATEESGLRGAPVGQMLGARRADTGAYTDVGEDGCPTMQQRRWPAAAPAGEAWEVHSGLLQLVALRHGLEYERCRLLTWMDGRRLHVEMGFRTCAEYAQRALGLAPREVKLAADSHAELAFLPALSRAWRDGRLGAQTVAVLARVADRDTDAAWVDHAKSVSLKHLLIHVDFHLACRALMAPDIYAEMTNGGEPLDDMTTRQLMLDWRELFGCNEAERLRKAGRRARRKGACSDASANDAAAAAEQPVGACTATSIAAPELAPLAEVEDPPELLAHRRRRVVVGFRAPRHVAAAFRHALRAQRRASGFLLDDGECVHVMLVHFAHQHAEDARLATIHRHRKILERDGWTCVVPTCRARRGLEVHHVRFRSAGGGNAGGNLAVLCRGCHDLIHVHRTIVLFGNAPDELVLLVGPRRGQRPRETWRGHRRVA